MRKSLTDRLKDSEKWLRKQDDAGLDLSSARAALATALVISEEYITTEARLKELSVARKDAVEVLADVVERAKLEKELRAKEARIRARITALADLPPFAE
jgi:hypothetical protein